MCYIAKVALVLLSSLVYELEAAPESIHGVPGYGIGPYGMVNLPSPLKVNDPELTRNTVRKWLEVNCEIGHLSPATPI